MEFSEKLQELRRNRGLTQEELAEALYVSRTAISKWESGKGYPSIDSLKEISGFFSVSIDELLSSEKLLSIARDENRTNIRKTCDLLIGVVDMFSFVLIILPLYPNLIDGYYYSVNLLAYTQNGAVLRGIYWGLYILLVLTGAAKILMTRAASEKTGRIMTYVSLVVSIITVLLLSMAKEAYAVTLVFLLLVVKGIILLRYFRIK